MPAMPGGRKDKDQGPVNPGGMKDADLQALAKSIINLNASIQQMYGAYDSQQQVMKQNSMLRAPAGGPAMSPGGILLPSHASVPLSGMPAPISPGKSNPNASDPSKTRHWNPLSYGNDYENNSYAFGNDYNMLEANLRTGMIGQPTFNSLLQYGSWWSGKKARTQFEQKAGKDIDKMSAAERQAVHDELMQDPSYARAIQRSSTYGGIATRQIFAKNLLGGIRSGLGSIPGSMENLTNTGAGPAGALDPYIAVEGMQQRSGVPLGGSVLSGAATERFTEGIGSKIKGALTYNWSGEQDAALKLSLRNLGMDPDSKRGSVAMEGMRKLVREEGMDMNTAMQLMDPQLRRGSKEEIEKGIELQKKSNEEFRKLGLNVGAANLAVLSFAEQMTGVSGMSRPTATAVGKKLTKRFGIDDPNVAAKILSNPAYKVNVALAAQELGPESVLDGRAQKRAADMQVPMMMKTVGLNSLEDLLDPKNASKAATLLNSDAFVDMFGTNDPQILAKVFKGTEGLSDKEAKRIAKGTWAEHLWDKGSKDHGNTHKVELSLTGDAKKWLKMHTKGKGKDGAKFIFDTTTAGAAIDYLF